MRNAGADRFNVVGESKRLTRIKICFARDKDDHFSRDKRFPALKCGDIKNLGVPRSCSEAVEN